MKAILAVSQNGVIGNNGNIPWDYTEERKFFRDMTKGSLRIMGSNTYWPLRGQLKNLALVSRYDTDPDPNVIIFRSVNEILKWEQYVNKEFWICGGAELYRTTRMYWTEAYVTVIHQNYEGDAILDEGPRYIHKRLVVKETKNYTIYNYIY